ncbi:hypothetical protein LTR85_001272 [Meristemomyces frigidus]|nr:hypothetical protein LTR85_001272 [Meristemomyces frigidus]
MERGGVDTIGKEHFTSLYSPARERAFTKRNVLAGWSKSGLLPFNPDRVLRDLPKPVPELLGADRVTAEPALYDAASTVPVAPVTPVTPVTPVSVEALMSLQNMIVTHDAQSLDQRGKHSVQRHLQKLTKAAHIFLAKNALQRDQIHFLLRTNNEAKIRRSTKSLVLGKARVVSYEDLVEARVERTRKEVAKEVGKKEKGGRKRKNNAPQADAQQLNAKMTRVTEAPKLAGALEHRSELHSAEGILVPEPQRAPVARMW